MATPRLEAGGDFCIHKIHYECWTDLASCCFCANPENSPGSSFWCRYCLSNADGHRPDTVRTCTAAAREPATQNPPSGRTRGRVPAAQPSKLEILQRQVAGNNAQSSTSQRRVPWRLWFQPKRPPAPPTVQTTPAIAADANPLATAAEEASVLLDIFSQASPDPDGCFSAENKQLVHSAFTRMLNIQKTLRTQQGNDEGVGEWPEGLDELSVNAGCVVCLSEVVDTLLMPCRHLVLCGGCCDRLGVMERGRAGRTVKCPVCRTGVVDRVKIFRS